MDETLQMLISIAFIIGLLLNYYLIGKYLKHDLGSIAKISGLLMVLAFLLIFSSEALTTGFSELTESIRFLKAMMLYGGCFIVLLGCYSVIKLFLKDTGWEGRFQFLMASYFYTLVLFVVFSIVNLF